MAVDKRITFRGRVPQNGTPAVEYGGGDVSVQGRQGPAVDAVWVGCDPPLKQRS